jgi:acetyltransferase-like isoleucine patch superfamily enzyme
MFMSSILRKIKNLLSFQWLVLIYRMYLQKLARFQVIWPMLSRRLLGFNCRAYYWKRCGCKLGENVNIGWDVYFDVHNAHLITIEDDVWIASRALLLCHRRNMSVYYKNERYNDLPYHKLPITIKKGACVSMGSMIMPGVTIGEGAVVGAYSLVTKDVPAWTVVAGNPAKVIKEIKQRENENI